MGKFTDKEYAEYMLANYILNYIDTSIFIAANLFDKYFHEKVPKKDVNIEKNRKKRDLSLSEYINLYLKNNVSKKDILIGKTNDLKNSLNQFRILRNDFIHGMDDNKIIQRKNEIGKFILYVYFSFRDDLPYDETIINDESTNNVMIQDYKIKEITERMIARIEEQSITIHSGAVKNFKGLEKKDFFNLFDLRKKLRYLQKIIEKNVTNIGLVPTILSPIDTTSAYIWMPFVDKEFTDNINKYRTERNNLLIGSVSILATPLDFRIYLDFGGGDFEYRMAFQKFLMHSNTIEYLKHLDKYKNYPLKIFDIRWYSFITCQNNLSNAISSGLINHLSEMAIDLIAKEEMKKEIIASGQNRIGYILPASDIDLKTIEMLFRNIAHFYYEFLIYKFKGDLDIKLLSQSQRLLTDHSSAKDDNDIAFSMDAIDKYHK